MASKLSAAVVAEMRRQLEAELRKATPVRTAKKKVTLSDKAKSIEDYIQKGRPFGCNTEAVTNLSSLILGETLNAPKAPGEVVKKTQGAAVVPLTTRDGHDYPLNKVCVCRGYDAKALKSDGLSGNNLPDGSGRSMRYATVPEIQAFVRSLTSTAVVRILGKVS